ncbi:U3 snoRNP protein [Bonamia ostreae]|uniref:U3 snoRNP protein n=1 Tax=Bonamia ostreae TaxID=126728 RepID=A0ABV2AFQ3_9EUKA
MNQNFGENWKILCLSLLSFGAVAKKGIVSKDSSLKNKLLNLWKSVLGLIENPHFWVRNAALKLVSDVLPFFDGKGISVIF